MLVILTSIEKRIAEHQAGMSRFTSLRLPIEVVFLEVFSTRDEAFAMERRIKGWGRKKKEALIAGSFERLRLLSKKVFK